MRSAHKNGIETPKDSPQHPADGQGVLVPLVGGLLASLAFPREVPVVVVLKKDSLEAGRFVWRGRLLKMKVDWTITLQKHNGCFLKKLVAEEGQRSYYVLTMANGIFIDDCHHGSFSGSRRKISDEIFKGYIVLSQSQSGPEPTWCQIKGSVSIY